MDYNINDDDKQLLTLAAIASDFKIHFEYENANYGSDVQPTWVEYSCIAPPTGESYGATKWNPLKYDADAFRLAVSLSICMEPWTNFEMGKVFKCTANITDAKNLRDDHCHGASEVHNEDPFGASRRAVVRVAATIGSKILEQKNKESIK